MHRRFAFFLSCILGFSYCEGLSVTSKEPAKVSVPVRAPVLQKVLKLTEPHSVLAQQGSNTTHTLKVSPILLRPSAGKGADVVKFAIQIMNFYGANMKTHTTALDMAMSIRWNDTRVIQLLPKGVDQLSMAWSQALEKLWMPGIVVTNRDIEKYEIISSSVTIFRTGQVLRVERANTRIMKKFALSSYPFDTQHLEVKVASSKYMSNELVLVEDKKAFGVAEKVFGLYEVHGWHSKVYETADGELVKSRGVLDIEVQRTLGKYFDDHLVPTFIVLTISWAVFFFPFVGPFITPRLVLSILALLTFTALMVKSAKELPGPAPFNWNDLLNQQIQTFMFLTIAINIFTESMYHQFHQDSLAKKMNNECKVIVPIWSSLNIVMVLGSGYYGWSSLVFATVTTKASVLIMVVGYAAHIYSHWSKQKELEALPMNALGTPRRASC